MSLRRLKSGDQLEGLPYKTWNAFVETAEAVAGNRGEFGLPEFASSLGSIIVPVQNATGSAKVIGDAYEIASLVLDTESQFVAQGLLPGTQFESIIAIALQPAAAGAICQCAISGVARARANILYTNVVTVDIDNGSSVLKSHLAGRFRLLNEATTTGIQTVWVQTNAHRQLLWFGVTDEEILPDGSGEVSINGSSMPVTAELDMMHSSEAISIGQEVAVRWVDNEALWRFVLAECEP